MILNQAENVMYSNKQIERIYLKDTLIWQRYSKRLPVTRGLQVVLYGEDYDNNTEIWKDVEHGKKFTGDGTSVITVTQNNLPAVSMLSSKSIATINNGVTNGFTMYCVLYNNDTSSYSWAQAIKFVNDAGTEELGSIFKGQNRYMMLNGTFYNNSYKEIKKEISGEAVGFFGVLVARFEPESKMLSIYGGDEYSFSTVSNQKFSCYLSNNKEYSNTQLLYSQFIAIGETYHTDEEVQQNLIWLKEHYNIPIERIFYSSKLVTNTDNELTVTQNNLPLLVKAIDDNATFDTQLSGILLTNVEPAESVADTLYVLEKNNTFKLKLGNKELKI